MLSQFSFLNGALLPLRYPPLSPLLSLHTRGNGQRVVPSRRPSLALSPSPLGLLLAALSLSLPPAASPPPLPPPPRPRPPSYLPSLLRCTAPCRCPQPLPSPAQLDRCQLPAPPPPRPNTSSPVTRRLFSPSTARSSAARGTSRLRGASRASLSVRRAFYAGFASMQAAHAACWPSCRPC